MKKFHFGFCLVLFTSLLILVKSADTISFSSKTVKEEFSSVSSKKTFKIEVSVDLEEYVKVEVNGQESKLINHVVDFKKKEDSEERVQLGQSLTSNTVMWLTKNQLNHGENYISVQCSKYDCDYQIILSTMDSIEIEIGEQLSYFVSENDQFMKFNFVRSASSASNDEYVTIWALGSRYIETELKVDEAQKVKHQVSNIYNLRTDEISSDVYILEIKKCGMGDLINVGSNLIKKGKSIPVKLNEPEKVGFINSEFNKNICFEIDTKGYSFETEDSLHLTGIFNEQIGEIYYENKDEEILDATIEVITIGSFSHRLDAETSNGLHLCVRLPTLESEKYDIKEISFSIQLTNSRFSSSKTSLYAPQKLGEIYPRLIPKDNILTFTSMPPFYEANNITFNILTVLGFPDMFYDVCDNYPLCDYDDEKLKNITDPHNINSMTTHTIQIDPSRTAISPKQDVLVVKCTEGNSKRSKEKMDEAEINTRLCEFYTLMFTDSESIVLQEGLLFNHFILHNESDQYTVRYTGQKTVQKVYVDLMIFTGDVIFDIDSKIEVHKYQNANKIFYSITVNPEATIKEMTFSVKAKKNSYYSIMYTLVKEGDDSLVTNHIPSGVSYLVTIEPVTIDSGVPLPGKKYINFKNLRVFDEHPFMVNFYSINCRLSVKAVLEDDEGKKSEVDVKSRDDYYTQDILTKEMFTYYSDEYTYAVYVDQMDFSIYNKKLCMAYVSCQELQEKNSLVERQILLSDNVPHQIIFEKGFNTIKYLYPLTSPEDDLAIKFYLSDQAKYSVTVVIGGKELRKFNVTSSQQIFLSHLMHVDYCQNGIVCAMIVEVVCDETYINSEPQLEVSIKKFEDNSTPTYIIKNKIRSDYVSGNGWQFYYTDIGENEEGEIVIDFNRGSGIIYAKVVEKNQTIADKDANWKQMYRFPKDKEDSLVYIPYLKTINIIPGVTTNCKNGCYLLISLKASVEGAFSIRERQFGYNLLVKTQPSDGVYNDYPLVNFPIDDYIVGNVKASLEKYIQIFYSVYFPHDADKIIIDFQSDAANVYVNAGAESAKPLTTLADFIFKSVGHDTLFEISKDKFLEASRKRKIIDENTKSLKGLSMIIGIWADKTDSVFSTVYSMKVHLPRKSEINIYDVNSDQKTLCKTTEVNGKNRCLFMIKFEQLEEVFSPLVYPIFEDQSIVYQMYADFIPKDKYDLYDEEFLKEKIPTEKAEFSTEKSKLDFIYLDLFGRTDCYLFITIVTDKPTTTELLSTFYTFDSELTPNPSTPQLFIIGYKEMKFNFLTDDDLSINLVSLNGEANVYWESDPDVVYHLRGRDDRLSLTSSIIYSGEDEKDKKRALSKLVIQNLHPMSTVKEEDFNNPKGFAFYVTYYLRSPMINFDQLTMGKSYNFEFRQSDLPVAIYSPLENQKKDTSIFLTFYDLIEENYSNKVEPIRLYASVIKQTTVYDIKLYPEIKPSYDKAIKGIYDASIRTGVITLKPKDIAKFGIKDEDKPTLVIQVEKGDNKLTYTRLSFEATVIQDGSLVPVTEKVYQFGKLNLDSDYNVYKLRTDKTKRIMRINIAFNSNHLNWAISTTPGSKTNDTSIKGTSGGSNGRLFYTFESNTDKYNYVYLTVFHGKSKAANEKLTNYVFKYINTNKTEEVKDYIVSNPKIEYIKKENNYEITINSVPSPNELKISYFVKFVSRKGLVEGESFKTIAATESRQTVIEYMNPKVVNNKLKFDIKDMSEDFSYLQVIAYINQGNIHEYVAYDSVFFKEAKGGVDTTLIVFIVISSILIIIAIVLVVIILRCNSKNKDLLDRVNQTSFQQEKEDNTQGDGLLYNENQGGLA